MIEANYPRKDIYDAIRDRGAKVTLRPVTSGSGPAPLPSPPIVEDAKVDGGWSVGDTAVNIRAVVARGILLAGDNLIVGGATYKITAPTTSRPVTSVAGFSAVPIASAIPSAIADGAAIDFAFASDVQTYGVIKSFPRRLVDGTLILASDLDLLVPAYNLPEPLALSRVVVAGKERTVVTVVPTYYRDVVISWRLQAR